MLKKIMFIFRVIAGLCALVLTFLGLALLIGPFFPLPANSPIPTAYPLLNAILGGISITGSVALWIWACRERGIGPEENEKPR
jgi:hypothetical protein